MHRLCRVANAGKGGQAGGMSDVPEGDAADQVPREDLAEQRAEVTDDVGPATDVRAGDLTEADEADVAEQGRLVGGDDDEDYPRDA